MIKTVLTWYRPLERKPPMGKKVLCHLPRDPEPVQLGRCLGFVWHSDQGFPFHHHVTHYAEIPIPPQKGKR